MQYDSNTPCRGMYSTGTCHTTVQRKYNLQEAKCYDASPVLTKRTSTQSHCNKRCSYHSTPLGAFLIACTQDGESHPT